MLCLSHLTSGLAEADPSLPSRISSYNSTRWRHVQEQLQFSVLVQWGIYRLKHNEWNIEKENLGNREQQILNINKIT
jgi:hypothetical protein